MLELEEVIEGRELHIRCWQCGWLEARTLSWVSSRRHMSCPTCSSVIVLDTSEVRREIVRQRKQLAALHVQMARIMETSNKQSVRTARPAAGRPPLDLALAHRHPDTTRRMRGQHHRDE